MRFLNKLFLSTSIDRQPMGRKTTFAVEPVIAGIILVTLGWMIFGSVGSGGY